MRERERGGGNTHEAAAEGSSASVVGRADEAGRAVGAARAGRTGGDGPGQREVGLLGPRARVGAGDCEEEDEGRERMARAGRRGGEGGSEVSPWVVTAMLREERRGDGEGQRRERSGKGRTGDTDLIQSPPLPDGETSSL